MKTYDIGERGFEFAVQIVRFVSNAQPKRIEYSLYDQLLRSGTSIGANIREGRASSSRKEFVRFYEIALRSANETTFWLRLMQTGLGIETNDVKQLSAESDELSRILAASIMRLKATMKR